MYVIILYYILGGVNINFKQCFYSDKNILMEGAILERIKREYNFEIDNNVAIASLIYSEAGRKALYNIWNEYISISKKYNLSFIATTPTRRADKQRISNSEFDESIILDNVKFLKKIREKSNANMFIGGLAGCKGDAYSADKILNETESYEYHAWKMELFKKAEVDFLYAGIMPSLPESIGMAKAMEKTNIPYIISFMIKKDGKLIDGTAINDAINIIDNSVDNKPICFMTNCVHPKILYEALEKDFNKTKSVFNRFKGIQANTAYLSPEELDNSADLKCCDEYEFAQEIKKLSKLVNLKIYGGCCGTNKLHIEEIAKIISK